MTQGARDWALALTRRSVLKQAKVRELRRAMGPVDDRSCLDLGGDNGAVSAALRLAGGEWASADLDGRGIASIREIVGGDVRVVQGSHLPFESSSFDLVVIADLLEHVDDDRAFARECARVLRPGGVLVVNVPHLKRRSLINRVRHAIGLTDAWHGHLRPGYSLEGLERVLGSDFRIESARTYSRAFSECLDLALNGGFELLRGRERFRRQGAKGAVVTSGDVTRHGLAFRVLGGLYPLLFAFSRLDGLLPLQEGYKLIVRARLVTPAEAAG